MTLSFSLLPIVLLLACHCCAAQDFVVAKDGSGHFITVQEAINAVPDFRKNVTTILIKKGIYKEKLILSASKINVRLVGEDNETTVLTFDDYASRKNVFGEEIGTSGSASFYIFGDDFTAENLTFANSAGQVGQAVAVRIDGDRIQFINCRFLGNQDTLYPHGEGSRQYYKNCYIEGTVDFIFGWSVAVFDQCVIYCKKGGGYVTAPSTPQFQPYGFIFLNCTITGDADVNSFYLGRPWRPYGKSVFINCFMDKQIRAEGWHNWNKPDAENTCLFGEFNTRGPGASKQRVSWAKRITPKEVADDYSLEKIFGDWKPSSR